MSEALEIARTIQTQMGGAGQLSALLGIRQFTATGDGMTFRFRGSRTANYCSITLTPDDLYSIEIYRIGKAGVKLKGSEDLIFGDGLCASFERLTGLYAGSGGPLRIFRRAI
jgi:hypothetical protein